MTKKVGVLIIAGIVCLVIGAVFLRANIGKKGRLISPVTEVDVSYKHANAEFSKGNLDKAEQLYKEIIGSLPESKKAIDSKHMLGLLYERQGNVLEAKRLLSEFIEARPDYPDLGEIQNKIWNMNIKMLFSPMSTPDNVKHKVKFGDTLNRIAKKHNTTVELIMKANGLADTNIKAGTELKVQNSNFSVLVDKSKKTLTLKSDDEVIKIYPIATGTNDSTPTGVFRGVNKIVNPPWYTPEGIIPPESPKNILGTRWYGLSEKGYGIHGTTEPESIGTSSTQGCVRMLNEDIEELYSILPVGTEVEIID